MSTPANRLTADLLIAIPKAYPNCRVWRQNTGGAVPMASVRKAVAALLDGRIKDAIGLLRRPISFGVLGGGDISGVMGPSGRRVEIEIKTTDKQSPEQMAFEKMVCDLGGLYVVARSVEECLAEIGRRM